MVPTCFEQQREQRKNLPQALGVVCLSLGMVHCLQSLVVARDQVTGRWAVVDVINANQQHCCFGLQRNEPPSLQHVLVPAFPACCSVSSQCRALLGGKNLMFLVLLPSYRFLVGVFFPFSLRKGWEENVFTVGAEFMCNNLTRLQ